MVVEWYLVLSYFINSASIILLLQLVSKRFSANRTTFPNYPYSSSLNPSLKKKSKKSNPNSRRYATVFRIHPPSPPIITTVKLTIHCQTWPHLLPIIAAKHLRPLSPPSTATHHHRSTSQHHHQTHRPLLMKIQPNPMDGYRLYLPKIILTCESSTSSTAKPTTFTVDGHH